MGMFIPVAIKNLKNVERERERECENKRERERIRERENMST